MQGAVLQRKVSPGHVGAVGTGPADAAAVDGGAGKLTNVPRCRGRWRGPGAGDRSRRRADRLRDRPGSSILMMWKRPAGSDRRCAGGCVKKAGDDHGAEPPRTAGQRVGSPSRSARVSEGTAMFGAGPGLIDELGKLPVIGPSASGSPSTCSRSGPDIDRLTANCSPGSRRRHPVLRVCGNVSDAERDAGSAATPGATAS